MAALACSQPTCGVKVEPSHQNAKLVWSQDGFLHLLPVSRQTLKGGGRNRHAFPHRICQVPAFCGHRSSVSFSSHRQFPGAVSWVSRHFGLGSVANTDLALRGRPGSPGATACRARTAVAVEEAITRLNVADFLRDSLPCSVLFGGYSFESQTQGPCFGRTVWYGEESTGLPEAHSWERADWQTNPSKAAAGPDVPSPLDSTLAESSDEDFYQEDFPPRFCANFLPIATPTFPPLPVAGIAALTAVVLLISCPSQLDAATLPISPPPQAGYWHPPLFELRPSLNAPVKPPSSTAVAYSSTGNSPRLPVLVYDPDELLREPPREEATKKAGDVKTPTDLAESLQKGCGGPQCIAVLFRPSTELEGFGFAGVVVLGVVSERRRSGLAQLQDLVRAAQDERQESEALVASLQQELQIQRSLLSDVLQQRIPLSHIQLDPRVIQARLPEKKPIGSREWMEGIGMRGLEAMGAKKGADVATLAPPTEQPYFPKMGQLHGHDVSKTRSLVPEGVTQIVDRTSRALGLAPGPSDKAESEGEESGRASSSVTAEAAAPAMRYVIPDTNQFLTNLPLVKKLRGTTGVQTVVPLAVLSELDGLQNHSNKRIGSLARRALRYLTQEMKAGVTWLRGQRRSEVRCLVGVDPAKRHGPGGGVRGPRMGWRQTTYTQEDPGLAADDALVDCCIHFLEGGSEVTLLTEDKTLQLKAMFHDISSVSLSDYLSRPSDADAHAAPVALPDRIDTEVALDQLRRYESTTTVRSPKRAAASGPRKETGVDRWPPSDPHESGAQWLDKIFSSEAEAGASSAERAHTEELSRTSRDGGASASSSARVEADSRVGAGKRSEAGSGKRRTEQRAEHTGEFAERGAESPGTSRGGQTRGGRGRENVKQAQGESGTRERPKTTRGRATTSGRRREDGRMRRGEDTESEGEGTGTKKGSTRNKTQGRRPRLAQTRSGKDDEQARSVVRGLADMLDGYAKEGDGKGSAPKAGTGRESGNPRRDPFH